MLSAVAVLREIKEENRGFGGHSFATFLAIGEQFPKMKRLDLLVVGGDCFPSRPLREWFDAGRHTHESFR